MVITTRNETQVRLLTGTPDGLFSHLATSTSGLKVRPKSLYKTTHSGTCEIWLYLWNCQEFFPRVYNIPVVMATHFAYVRVIPCCRSMSLVFVTCIIRVSSLCHKRVHVDSMCQTCYKLCRSCWQYQDLARALITSNEWVAIDSDYDDNLYYVIDRRARSITVKSNTDMRKYFNL